MAIDLRTAIWTGLALVCFAANSLLCRLALAAGAIDATPFTAIRLAAGAVMLGLLVRLREGRFRSVQTMLRPARAADAWAALALFLYAILFSYAYLRIGAATGALVLFGCVQLTMLSWAVVKGERPRPLAWTGFLLAVGGLVWLLAPSTHRPDLQGALQMAVAGIAWGAYTVLGRNAGEPLAANARSFLWSCPLALLLACVDPGEVATSTRGVVLAVVSGALTSGLGYAIWYRALSRLTVSQAAIAQLSVPVFAAFGAVAWLDETVTMHLLVASAIVLGGVALAMLARMRSVR